MVKQNVPITNEKLLAKLEKAWDGKSVYVMLYPKQYRVIITDNGKPMFYDFAEEE